MLINSIYTVPFVLACCVGGSWYASKVWSDGDAYRRQPVVGKYRYTAVAEDAGICAPIGTDIMVRQNGSTTDAAIAVELCSVAANPQSAGLSGDLFMTIYDTPRGKSGKEMMTIIARGAAPLAATRDMFKTESSLVGGKSIAVPGYIKGLYAAWQRYGRLEWSKLVMPTVDLLRKGVPTHRVLVLAFNKFSKEIQENENLRILLTKPDGSYYKLNERIKRPKLAKTYEKIAANPLAMYEEGNPLANDFLADIKDYGGIITSEDMTSYKARVEKPYKVHLKNGGYDVYAPPPPSGGPVFLHILEILDGYNFTSESIASTPNKVLTYHRMIEAFKFAYAKRSALGDPKFAGKAQEKLIQKMLSAEYSESRRHMISDHKTHSIEFYEPEFEAKDHQGTSHISLLGLDGSGVGVTSSINMYFGSKQVGTRTGIIFGNQMDDFSVPGKLNHFGLPPSPANYIEPGKMPMSTICPFIILDDEGATRMVAGASGGSAIASTMAFIVANAFWFKKDLAYSTGVFRFHHQLMPNYVCLEGEFEDFKNGNQKIVSGLKAKGHEIQGGDCFLSVAQSIQNNCDTDDLIRDKPCIEAVSDGRKVGIPDGV